MSDPIQNQTEFLEQIAAEIRKQGGEKRVLAFGDTWHPEADIYGVMFSRPVLEALAEAGFHEIHVEREPHGIHTDKAVQGKHIKPEHYKLVNRPTLSTNDTFGSALRDARDDYYAYGLLNAVALRTIFHLADPANGVFKSAQQHKQYLFVKQERERQWVSFLLKNQQYFDDPSALINRLIDENRERYAKRNIDLECLRPQHQNGLSPRKIVREFWEMDQKKILPEIEKLERPLRKSMEDMPFIVRERQKMDIALCGSFNKQSKGEKFAIFYGSGHFRNVHGGLLAALKPEETAVFQIWPDYSVMQTYKDGVYPDGNGTTLWEEHICPDDISIVLNTQQISRTADLKPD